MKLTLLRSVQRTIRARLLVTCAERGNFSRGSSNRDGPSRGEERRGYSSSYGRSSRDRDDAPPARRPGYPSGPSKPKARIPSEHAPASSPPRERSFSSGPARPVVSPTSTPSGAFKEEKAPYPTFVPRNENIKEGVWNALDQKLVQDALADAGSRAASSAAASSAPASSKVAPVDILMAMTLEELQALAEKHGQPKYRGKQLADAMLKGHKSIAEFSTIPKEWREKLTAEGYKTGRSTIFHTVNSKDGTKKFLLQCSDGRVLETVGIPAQDGRLTVCVSSQVGCPMRCNFCATGKGGFARNLYAHEIVDQVMTVQEEFGTRVSNVVFMGMGEPLLNLPNVLRAHEMLNKTIGIGARHLTISTVGVPNAIQRFAEAKLQSRLAVSLHAPNQRLREELVPSAKVYPLEALMQDCFEFFKITGRRVSFEYTLLAGVNDRPEHAKELAALLKRFGMTDPNVGRPLPGESFHQQKLRAERRAAGITRSDDADRSEDDDRRSGANLAGAHVNLIPYNPVDDSEYQRPTRATVDAFAEALRREGVNVTVRITRGMDVSAACGMLRNEFVKKAAPLGPMVAAPAL